MAALQLTQESIVARLDELPALPSVVYELSQVINDPMSSTTEVEKIMSSDISLTSQVLRLVNSAYYAIPGGVTSLSRAIGYIGFDTVNQLVLSTSILKALETKEPHSFDVIEFWRHSVGVGIAAETIGKFVRHSNPADLFTCGLVHDMGKVALYSIEPRVMAEIVKKADQGGITYLDAEKELGIPNHTVIGAALAQKWHLPSSIQATIKHHHTKEHNQRGGLTADANRNVDIVFLANLLIHALKFGKSGHAKILGAPHETLERLALQPERDLKLLLHEIKGALDKASDFLRTLGGPP